MKSCSPGLHFAYYYDIFIYTMLERMPVDHLTGLFSRESLKEFLQENILEAASERKLLFLTLVDLDHFKNFNDKLGHVFGDEILKYASEMLRSVMGEDSNYFFRYGGDEFIVISLDTDMAKITRSLKNFNASAFYQPFLAQNKSYKITLSAGIATFPKDAQTVEELIGKADKAMYFSKRHGRKMIVSPGAMKRIFVTDIFALSVLAIVGLYTIMYLFVNPLFIDDITSYIAKQASRVKIVVKRDRPDKPALPKQAPVNPVPPPVLPEKSTLDKVKLKDGGVYEGRILVNNSNGVIITIKKEKGEFMFSIPASKVESVKYGASAGAK